MESSDSYEVISSVSSALSELVLVDDTCLSIDLGQGLVPYRSDWPEQLTDNIEAVSTSSGVVFRQTSEVNPPLSSDPTQLLYFLHFHPFHVETLEKLSMHYEKIEDWDLAEGTLEHILYAFQLAVTRSGLTLVDITIPAAPGRLNILFFDSLQRLIAMQQRRKLLGKALELAKLQLRLKAGNELDCILQVEQLSIETESWSFLKSFQERYMSEFHGEGELLWIPSSLYNSALAYALQLGQMPVITPQDISACDQLHSFQDLGSASATTQLLTAVCLYPCVASLLLGRRLSTERQAQTESTPLGSIRQLSCAYADRFGRLWAGWPLQWLNSVWVRAPRKNTHLLSLVRPTVRLPVLKRKLAPEPACGAPLWALLGAVFSWNS